MEEFKKHSGYDCMEASIELFIKIFGQEAYDKMSNLPPKAFDWDGLDIDCPSIKVVGPDIKERFDPEYFELNDNFEDSNRTALKDFINSIFDLGYNQCYAHEVAALKNKIEDLKKDKESYRDEAIRHLHRIKELEQNNI